MANYIICDSCNTKNSENAKFCIMCGEKIVNKNFDSYYKNFESKQVSPKEELKKMKEPSTKSKEDPGKKINKNFKNNHKNLEESKKIKPKNEIKKMKETTSKSKASKKEDPYKLVLEEIILEDQFLILNKRGKIENWKKNNNSLGYVEINNIKIEEQNESAKITILMDENDIVISDVELNLGKNFVKIANDKISEIKIKAQKKAEALENLKKSQDLRDAGLITENDFKKIKEKIEKDIY